MKKRRQGPPEPQLRACGHEDPYERLSILELPDGTRMAAAVCWQCANRYAQEHPIPCVGHGGFDLRGHSAEYNSPTGYYGGGHFAGHWFPWCPGCFEPLPVVCMHCMGHGEKQHVCGRPLQLSSDAVEKLAWYWSIFHLDWLHMQPEHLAIPVERINLRSPIKDADLDEFAVMLGQRSQHGYPDAKSLWPSVDEAWEAVAPRVLEITLARRELYLHRDDERPKRKSTGPRAFKPEQMDFALGTGADAFTKALKGAAA